MSPAPAAGERTLALQCRDDSVGEALRFAELATTLCTPECREAVALAVCELGENLIKYGDPNAGAYAGTIGLSVEDARIVVRATNRVSSLEDAERVAELVRELGRSDSSVQDLYKARLQDLFSNPDEPRTQLGLLRMAFEGGFRLSCRFEAPELHIIAERTC
jgi:hypothetical protein